MKVAILMILAAVAMGVRAQQPVTTTPETAQTAVIMDLETGEIVASCNPYMMLTPASLTKMITTAAGLEYLGEDFRFKTQMRFGKSGSLQDELAIRADGDPTIGSTHFPECTMGKVVAQFMQSLPADKKIDKYDVVLEDYYFTGAPYVSKRLWEDMGNYYGAAYGTYNIGDNAQVVHLTSNASSVWQSTKGEKGKAERVDKEKMTIYAKTYAGKSDSAYIYGIGTKGRYISGAIPVNKVEFQVKAAMGNPEEEYLDQLSRALVGAGMKEPQKLLSTKVPKKTEGRLVATYQSPRLLDIIKVTNQKSVNLFADAICYALGRQEKEGIEGGMTSNWDDAMARLRQYADKSMGRQVGAKLYDGAGLSPMNAISAYQMASMLRYIYNQQYYKSYRSTLATSGQSGTLRSFGKGTKLEGKIDGKSGSMTGVVAYAGYILDKYSFCIIFNNAPEERNEVRRQMVKWLIQWGL